MADGDEDAVDVHGGLVAGLGIGQLRMGDTERVVVAHHLDEVVIPEDLDLRILEQALLQDLLGPQLVAAMHQGHLVREVGQIERFLDGRIAAADHDHVLAAIEEAVAGGASGYAEALKLVLRGQAQPARLRTGGDDERVRQILVAAIAFQPERALGEVRLDNGVRGDLRAHMLGLGAHLFHQPRALDHFGEARVVLHIGGDGHLAAGLDAFDQQRFQHGAGRVDGRGVAGRTGADDDHLFVAGTHWTCLLFMRRMRDVSS